MHVVVCIKQVPDTTEVRIDPKTNTLVRAGVPSIMNPYDIHAVEEAVRIKEQVGGKVTVITMGPPAAVQILKEAVSLGADETVLVTDRVFAASDTFATSYVLASTIQKIAESEPVDLVFTGKQAIDGDTAQTGPGIAQRMNLPLLTYVEKVRSVDVENKKIVVERRLEGSKQIVESTLPALLTVEKEINDVRYATLPNLIKAATHNPKAWDHTVIEADKTKVGLKGSPTRVGRSFVQQLTNEPGEIIEGTPQEAVVSLVDKLFAEGHLVADR